MLGGATGCVVAKRLGLLGAGVPYWVEALSGVVISAAYLRLTAARSEAKRYRKHFERRFPPDRQTAWVDIDESGISSAIVGTDPESFEWCKIVDFAQDEKMTLFYLTKKKFLLFPTPLQESVQRAELADLIGRHFSASGA